MKETNVFIGVLGSSVTKLILQSRRTPRCSCAVFIAVLSLCAASRMQVRNPSVVNPKLILSNRLFIHKLLMSIKIEMRRPSSRCPCPRKKSLVYFSGSHPIPTHRSRGNITCTTRRTDQKWGKRCRQPQSSFMNIQKLCLINDTTDHPLRVTRRNMSIVITQCHGS